ncbi:GON7 subunit of KEOPS complex [Rhinolophus ferrumequinum]|uniref:GON7 subunit of KEOPS complex n=1 Tax=Rhinolophus ferrumequinum TaxID=59479 RepID=A0A7J7XPY6_RHIFE|nr:EKC/KEOPS complex subunit GON7 isoform X2 [Rhinolophus ferrumequinum]KAF6351340.1 GON7 subunit of KEOPS complex [Rhinolophus ferrumequinum]
MELLGEYVGPDGQRQQLEVPCESPGDADPFQSLLSGVAQMRELVAEHFGPLVQREAQDRVAAAPDEALDVSVHQESGSDFTSSSGPRIDCSRGVGQDCGHLLGDLLTSPTGASPRDTQLIPTGGKQAKRE